MPVCLSVYLLLSSILTVCLTIFTYPYPPLHPQQQQEEEEEEEKHGSSYKGGADTEQLLQECVRGREQMLGEAAIVASHNEALLS